MSPEDNPVDSDFDEASAQLNEGLKTCRSVVRNYRIMLNRNEAALSDRDADFTGSPANDL